MHNWTTVYLRRRGSKPEVSEDVSMFHELRVLMRVLVQLNILLICFLEFTVDHTHTLYFKIVLIYVLFPVTNKRIFFFFFYLTTFISKRTFGGWSSCA